MTFLMSYTLLDDLLDKLRTNCFDAVLLDDFAVIEHIELLRGVFTCEQHDRFRAARMVRQEFGDVIHVVTNDDPTIRCLDRCRTS